MSNIHPLDFTKTLSKYRSGEPHAEAYWILDKEIGGWRRHGKEVSLYANGSTKSIEFYCRGFEVGFHQYFDSDGHLSAMAGYSRSDYEWNKARELRTFRDFYIGESHLGTSIGLERVQRFREVYVAEYGLFERKIFSAADVFDPRWNSLDLQTSVEQWTRPGEQGVARHGNDLLLISSVPTLVE